MKDVIKVRNLKAGQKFRILKKKYELLKLLTGSAYVKELGSERSVTVVDKFSDEEHSFTGGSKKYIISPEAEVDEVLG